MSDPNLTGSETKWSSPRFALVEERWDTSDGAVRRPVIRHPGAVAIIAQPTPDTVLLVRQWRYSIRAWTLEIPAGTRTVGEPALITAQRELQEEAGYRADSWKELGTVYPAVGVSDEALVVFLAQGLYEMPAAPDPGELVSRQITALHDLPAALGQISDAKTLVALAWLGITPFAARLTGAHGG